MGLDYIFVLGNFGFPAFGVGFAGISSIITMGLNLFIFHLLADDDIRIFSNLKSYFKNPLTHIFDSKYLFLQEIVEGSIYTLFINMLLTKNWQGRVCVICGNLCHTKFFIYVQICVWLRNYQPCKH